MTARQRRSQWSVLAVNGAVAGTVLVLVAVLALVVKPPAPPGIAAFAPQAAKPITKAPQAQSAQSGEGAGACGQGQVCAGSPTPSPTTPSPSAGASASASPTGSPQGVPSSLQCYEWPDGSVTQTFDPQSPPCIASWDEAKGNGGATSPGVTPTEIRVALPTADEALSTWPALRPLVDFFNTRFQLYGRKIRIVPFVSQQANQQQTGTFNDPVSQRADAAQVTQLKVFASHDFVDPLHYSWTLPVFRDVLTKHKILSINGGETSPYGTAADMAKNAPYEWTYYPTADTLMQNVATMTCRQLVGRPASHAPDAAWRDDTRKFALLIPTEDKIGGPMPGLSSLLRILDGCGVTSPRVVRYNEETANQPALAASFRELADDGVTSVILEPADGSSYPLDVASRVNYRPEWVVIGSNNYKTHFLLHGPTSETSGAFGVGIWNKYPQLELEFWYQAFLAAGGPQDTVTSGVLPSARAFYQELMLLASGIQLAGPVLTPESFAAGLQSTTFPNPGAGLAPSYQGTVGFTPGDVAMVNDYAAFWLDIRTTGREVTSSKNVNTHKATCYVALGRRFRLDTWPGTDGYYQGGCR